MDSASRICGSREYSNTHGLSNRAAKPTAASTQTKTMPKSLRPWAKSQQPCPGNLIVILTYRSEIETNCALQASRTKQLMVAKGPKPTHCTPGLQVVALPNESFEEFFVTVFAVGNESSSHLTERLEAFIGSHPELRIVRQDVFGQDMDSHATCLGPKPFAQRTKWPVTVITGKRRRLPGRGCPNPCRERRRSDAD